MRSHKSKSLMLSSGYKMYFFWNIIRMATWVCIYVQSLALTKMAASWYPVKIFSIYPILSVLCHVFIFWKSHIEHSSLQRWWGRLGSKLPENATKWFWLHVFVPWQTHYGKHSDLPRTKGCFWFVSPASESKKKTLLFIFIINSLKTGDQFGKTELSFSSANVPIYPSKSMIDLHILWTVLIWLVPGKNESNQLTRFV